VVHLPTEVRYLHVLGEPDQCASQSTGLFMISFFTWGQCEAGHLEGVTLDDQYPYSCWVTPPYDAGPGGHQRGHSMIIH
jgi:hypothetical protein